jgi:endonuclease-3
MAQHIATADLSAVAERLGTAIPTPECELDFGSDWELLVATILSAQSTDKRVNLVTPELFRRWPGPRELAAADELDVQEVIRSTGFFRNKAKAIVGAARLVVGEFGGQVPRTADELVRLPGVARKTANVVLGSAHGIASGFTVDTHAGRVARRLGITDEKDPVKVEKALCAAFPKETWVDMSHRLVLHGRYVCLARKPACARCPLTEVCPSAEAAPTGDWPERARAEQRVVESRGAIPLG